MNLRVMLAATLLIVLLVSGGWLYLHIHNLQTELAESQKTVGSLTVERDNLIAVNDELQKRHNAQITAIQKLEVDRKANAETVNPFVLRIDQLTTTKETNSEDSFVGRFNSLNADINRMLEQSSR